MPKRQPSLTRYVYLMERVSGRTWRTIATGRREIKIGISKTPKSRQRRVNKGVRGRVVLLCQYKIKQASKVESQLHDLFDEWHMPIKGAKKGAGGTEFYRLNNRQIRKAKSILQQRSGQSKETINKIVLEFMFWLCVGLFLLLMLQVWIGH